MLFTEEKFYNSQIKIFKDNLDYNKFQKISIEKEKKLSKDIINCFNSLNVNLKIVDNILVEKFDFKIIELNSFVEFSDYIMLYQLKKRQ
jgi:hypothetical protein